jgi:hypothetical protein
MFELFWAVWTIPKVIYPAAESNGKSGLRWTLYSIILFFTVEISILAFYFYTYFAFLEKYKLPKHPEYFWLTYVIYVFALICGLLSVDSIRRFLIRKEEVYKSI